jgi:hypothetical protein
MELEPTTTAFELAKTVHASDRVATVIDTLHTLAEILSVARYSLGADLIVNTAFNSIFIIARATA